MNKEDLVKAIASDSGLTQVDVRKFFTSFENVILDTVKKGGKVQWTGFVNIKPVARAARKGYDPVKLEPVDIAATVGLSVKAGEKLKKSVDELKYEDFAKEEK